MVKKTNASGFWKRRDISIRVLYHRALFAHFTRKLIVGNQRIKKSTPARKLSCVVSCDIKFDSLPGGGARGGKGGCEPYRPASGEEERRAARFWLGCVYNVYRWGIWAIFSDW